MTLNFQDLSDNELWDCVDCTQQEIDRRRAVQAQELQDELYILISRIQNLSFHLDMRDMHEQHFSLDPDSPLYIKISL